MKVIVNTTQKGVSIKVKELLNKEDLLKLKQLVEEQISVFHELQQLSDKHHPLVKGKIKELKEKVQ